MITSFIALSDIFLCISRTARIQACTIVEYTQHSMYSELYSIRELIAMLEY